MRATVTAVGSAMMDGWKGKDVLFGYSVRLISLSFVERPRMRMRDVGDRGRRRVEDAKETRV